MKYAESAPIKDQALEPLPQEIHDLLDGPASADYNRRQIQLTAERLIKNDPETALDRKTLDDALFEWATSPSSKGFATIARHPYFKSHPRFQGDISKITLADVDESIRTGMMPEQ